MFRSISRVLASVVRAGRIRHAFAGSVAIGAVVITAVTAMAFYAATGAGSISNVQAGTVSDTVTIQQSGSTYTYAGPSTTALLPGGTVSTPLTVFCSVAGCPSLPTPVHVSTVNLTAVWTSNKVGCDSVTLPNSFSMPVINVNTNITAAGVSSGITIPASSVVITWANLAISQNACAGATFTFNFVSP